MRPSLIPLLISFFQYVFQTKKVYWGRPSGATLGILEYLSQSNNCADFVNPSDRFKFIDDLTILEIINLLTIGISSYNIKLQVPNDVSSNNKYIHPDHLETQSYLNLIKEWTDNQRMKLNEKKTKIMIFNSSEKNAFTTRLQLSNQNIEILTQTKLLGTVITKDLKWNVNTDSIVKKANARLQLLIKVAQFNPPKEDLKLIYTSFIRSLLEQSCVVWHSSLTKENANDLERVQKTCMKVIFGENYKGYKKSLNMLDLRTLSERREALCLNFAKKCLTNEKLKHMFPLNEKNHLMNTRKSEKFEVKYARKEKLKKSAIIHMQNILIKMK